MTQKLDIVEQLGEAALVLPELIARGLAANDRVKYYMALLEACREHADAGPGAETSDLRLDREAAGEEDAGLDRIIAGSRRDPGGGLVVPRASDVHARMLDAVARMLAPVRAGPASGMGDAPEAYASRLEALGPLTVPDGDRLPADYLDLITSGDRQRGDSLHLLVMDLHKALNLMQAELYVESIDGASAYALSDDDRALVRAFMRGVDRTAALKLAHPGLETTATRSGNRLVIQNDLGTTEAHVLVAHVDGLDLSFTYTDIHRTRAQFFEDLFSPLGVQWTRRVGAGAGYETRIGHLKADSRDQLEHHLTVLGSRLVFLIDWNRARKRLSRFVGKGDAVAILQWAADHDIGHRAFLEAGGERLVSRALDRIPGVHLPYGVRLDEVVGADAARRFLCAVLRITSEGYARGRSLRLIRDEVEAELIELFHETAQGALALVADHAALIASIAVTLRDALLRAASEPDAMTVTLAANRAKRWESRADEIVQAVRGVARQTPGTDAVRRLLLEADDVADGLEEATFRLTLLQQRGCGAPSLGALQELAELAVRGGREWVKGVEAARDIQRGGGREDVEEFLVAVDRLVTVEHDADAADRRAQTVFLDAADDFRELHLLSQVASGLEAATDSLARCGLMLKDHVLGDVMAEP